MEYNLGKIRELIDKALTPEDLENLLSDEFRRIYDNCYGQNKGYKIRSLIDYANRQGEIAKLLRLVEEKNPNCYEQYRHQVYLDVPMPQEIDRTKKVAHKKKILILSANPQSASELLLSKEVREIEQGLKLAKRRDEFEIISKWAVRPEDIRRALLDYEPEIVHFCGHGTGDRGLVLENDLGEIQLVSTKSLADLFQLFESKIECVVLNACYSEVQAKAIYEHIDCVVGMNQEIEDEAAIKFAVGFYDALGAGRSYEDAFKFGRNSIDLAGLQGLSIPILKFR
jgi:CHAT domain/Effector-associated domain 7